MKAQKHTAEARSPWRHWRGLGAWNYYFLLKFALLAYGYLNFHPLANLCFMAALLFPLPSLQLHRLRQWLALPVGIVLFYYDTWLPSLSSIIGKGSQWSSFSADYALELLDRFINWQMVGFAFVLLIAYLFFSQWLRITLFVIVGVVWLNLQSLGMPTLFQSSHTVQQAGNESAPAQLSAPIAAAPVNNGPASNAALNSHLAQFFAQEKGQMTKFPSELPADAQPFDLLILNICSLSWSDIEASQLSNHPLWGQFDILFKNFNSATSYSGPAAIRLLRASCGQQEHRTLYEPVPRQCYLFNNLAQLGFTSQLVLDHAGEFDNYLKNLRQYADIQAEPLSKVGISTPISAFNGEPIYDDLELLDRWLKQLPPTSSSRTATFMNMLPLHDGNRLAGGKNSADYQPRLQKLFDELNTFIEEARRSDRKLVIVLAPEHGAALVGDKLQMSGLRDIPSPSITHIPVGIAFIGMQAPRPAQRLDINTPTSYLALSELVTRMVDGKLFVSPSVDWQALTLGLPQTEAVAENDSAVVIQYQGRPYIKLNGANWVPYPQ